MNQKKEKVFLNKVDVSSTLFFASILKLKKSKNR